MERADESPGFASDEILFDWYEPLPVFSVGPRVAILACLSESLALRGYPPTIQEIADTTGLWPSRVQSRLERLRAEGYVTWNDGERRTLRFCSGGSGAGDVAGRLPAGSGG